MTNSITNLCYIVNPVVVGQDWDAIQEFFFMGFQCGIICGAVVWIALLVKSGLRVPRMPFFGD